MSSDFPFNPRRRGALKCLTFGDLGTMFVLAGGILMPVDVVDTLKQTGDRHDARGPVALDARAHRQHGTGNFAEVREV